MNIFDLPALLVEMDKLEIAKCLFLTLSTSKEKTSEAAQSPAQIRESMINRLTLLRGLCSGTGLTAAATKIETSIRQFSDSSLLPLFAMMQIEIRNVIESVLDEVNSRRFLYISADRSDFLDQQALFGENVSKAFPSASFDIKEAGNCLAAECSTAGVFHLMRVAEHGLRALARDRQIPLSTALLEVATWEKII